MNCIIQDIIAVSDYNSFNIYNECYRPGRLLIFINNLKTEYIKRNNNYIL
jgi:hypothetical protein